MNEAEIPHAFGGAIALAYCTNDPRGTRDLDINIFLKAEKAEKVLRALPTGVAVSRDEIERVEREGQVRLWWDETPVDLFFNNLPFHETVAKGAVQVPLEGREIPVLGGASLIVFKAMFDRSKDWVDIEAIIDWDRAPAEHAATSLAALLGDEDPISQRLQRLLD